MRTLLGLIATLSACSAEKDGDTAPTCTGDIGQLEVSAQWSFEGTPYTGVEGLMVEPAGEAAYQVSASGSGTTLDLPAGDYRVWMPSNTEQCFSDEVEATVEACQTSPAVLSIDCMG